MNVQSRPSYDQNGNDIPLNDISTVRFFYNLGHEFFRQLQTKHGLSSLVALSQSGGAEEQRSSSRSNLVDHHRTAGGGDFALPTSANMEHDMLNILGDMGKMKIDKATNSVRFIVCTL